MIDQRIKKIKYANYPMYKEKYIIADGQIYLNLSADPGCICIARFIRSADAGAGKRDR